MFSWLFSLRWLHCQSFHSCVLALCDWFGHFTLPSAALARSTCHPRLLHRRLPCRWRGVSSVCEDGRARLMAVPPCVSCSHVGGGRVCSGREGDRPSERPVGRFVHLQSASAKNACVLPSSRHPTVYRLKNSVRVFTSETATSSRSAGPSQGPPQVYRRSSARRLGRQWVACRSSATTARTS